MTKGNGERKAGLKREREKIATSCIESNRRREEGKKEKGDEMWRERGIMRIK